LKKIELLYFDGCPSWEAGLRNLKAALALENIDTSIELIKVESDVDAESEKFLGSPSFRIDGKDLWFEERQSFSLGCRVYASGEELKGFPTVTMLQEKIRNI
jgi:hypothetical protein